ncbi:MAG: type II secretion system protein J [Rubrobacteraceae bacterium]
MKHRLLREEGGFTLPEVLVTMILMVLVMFALYSIFDMSVRVFSFGNDEVEAAENARIGLARMEREIRAAYPQNKPAGDETLFLSDTGDDAIAFGNDLNGDRAVGPGEEVRYTLDGTTLKRNGQRAVGFVESLQLDYLDEFGDTQSDSGTRITPNTARLVRVTLVIDKDGRTQTLSTDVLLRNRDT